MLRLVKFLLLVWLVLLAGAVLWWGLPLLYAWPQSGFGEYIEPQQGYQRGKTLWDWLQLLIVPVVLALAAIWFNRSEKRNEITAADKRASLDRELAEKRAQTEREVAQDNLREFALQGYFDRMSELLLHENIREPEESKVRAVARSRTLAIVRRLDGHRKGSLVQFLMESALINREAPVISLRFADLREVNLGGANLGGADLSMTALGEADLSWADLTNAALTNANLGEADLGGAALTNANLTGAILRGAMLRGANLSLADLGGAILSLANLSLADLGGANLTEADLGGAILTNANLTGAILRGATLGGAILTNANLSGATVTKAQLDTAAFLQGATLPDGTTVPDDEGMGEGVSE